MTEHPFAQYIQILGKGQHGARSLTQQEAEQAMRMILAGEVEPIQLGAFLMLMRVKEETPEELAGFVRAARASLSMTSACSVDLDWASYAGKRRHLPWFLMSALLLASHGVSVLMHGVRGGSADRVYIPQVLEALGVVVAETSEAATAQLAKHRFAYLPLDVLSPQLDQFLKLKSLLGLRSPVHTIVRMLNPYAAPTSIMGIFHPGYDETHQQAGVLLKDSNLAVFKGEGGEAERNPDSPCVVRMLRNSEAIDDEWPALFQQRHLKDAAMDVGRLAQMWRGDIEDEYGKASILATAAIALRVMGKVPDMPAAEQQAERLWADRDGDYLNRLQQ